jgi:type VI secretion system protein ImpL
MNLEHFLNLHYQMAGLIAFGLFFLMLLGMAFLWLRWHEASNFPEEDADAEALPSRSTRNSLAARHLSSSKRDPRFLLLGASAAEAHAAFDGLMRGPKLERGAEGDPFDVSHWLCDGGDIVAVSVSPAHPDRDYGKKWVDLLTELKRRRNRRPLDGLILNLPANLLMGPAALSTADLLSRAAGTARQLQILRKQLGFCLPVYLLITGCEAVQGFAAFVQAQDKPDLNQILGWSSPYSPDVAFSPRWIAQAFGEVQRGLAKLRLEWFAQTAHQTSSNQALSDDLFLFPSAFQALESPVTGFLNSMFEELGQRGALEFRGLYFSAELSFSTEASETAWEGHGNPEPQFTLDLLRTKIIPERVLARPIDSAFARRAAVAEAARAACVLAAFVLGSGTLLGSYRLSKISDHALPELEQVNAALSTGDGAANASSAYAAIDAAQKLSGRNFRSVFFPVSLVRPLDPGVRQTMRPVFNQLVYPAMRAGLEQKIAGLVQTPNPPATSPQSLTSFIDALLRLEDNILLFNQLASYGKGDGSDLLTLASYLNPQAGAVHSAEDSAGLGATLRRAARKILIPFFTPDQSGLDAIVRSSYGQPLDGQPWIKPTTGRLASMLADPNLEGTHLLETLDTAADQIDQLDDTSFATIAQPEKLKATLDLLTTQSQSAANWFASTGLPTDIDKALQPVFSRPPLTNILLCDSTMQPNPCANVQDLKFALQTAATADFDDLRQSIQDKQTGITGLLMDTSGKLQVSQPTAKLQLALAGYLQLPFVADREQAELRDVLPGERLLWDNNRLQVPIQDKAAYDSFYTGSLASAPVAVQDIVENAALAHLRTSMVYAVSLAQQFQLPPTAQANAAGDDASMEEARSFQAASRSLGQVLDAFNDLHFDQEYDGLERVTTDHAQAILQRLDSAFQAKHLYWPPQGNFNSWTAGSLPSVTAYDQKTLGTMPDYLIGEQQQVEKFAAATQIVVAYLDRHVLRKADLSPAVAKWQGISSDLQKFDASAPSTGLGSLEQFLSSGMDKTAPPECQLPASQVNSPRLYFVQLRRSLEQSLVSRCHALSDDSATSEYAQLAMDFNHNLATKFPFCSIATCDFQKEADPTAIIEFFSLLDLDESSIREGLVNSSQSSDPSQARIKAFLLQLDALRPLFASLLSGQPGAVPAFDIAPVFRVNRRYEVQGNQIGEWRFTIGDNTNRVAEWVLSAGDSAPRTSGATSPGHWTYRDPVSLTLRWAKDSTMVPVSAAPAAVDQKSRTVVYQFRDPWSLLRMLVQMAPPASNFERGVDPDPQTILFNAQQENSGPVIGGAAASGGGNSTATSQTAGQPVEVFMRIRISAPGKTDALRIPIFPTQAPPGSGTQ